MRTPGERLAAILRGQVADERVLAAVSEVPRDRFVPEELRPEAWENIPLPIGAGQTISQPLVVARMCELLELRGDERVLDVGTGSGYHAALLARLSSWVWSLELHAELSRQAAANLAAAGIENVTLLVGDGCRGLPEEAPFDAINVAAAAATGVPAALEEQLAPGGRLVAPVEDDEQRLVVERRIGDVIERRTLERVRFVPLVRGR
jgi:protein-L-isoaspartate(D-aspartate) O-methyltransferase